MPYILVSDFKAGMDRRRSQAAGAAGTLWTAENCFVSRGGDIVRAKKFVPTYTLPANTFGLAEIKDQLYVFGSAAAPSMPTGVQYQRLQSGSDNMTRVLDAEVFDGGLYVVAEFDDGGIYHFYDGARVTEWDALADAVSGFSLVAEVLARKVSANAAVSAKAVGADVGAGSTAGDHAGAVANTNSQHPIADVPTASRPSAQSPTANSHQPRRCQGNGGKPQVAPRAYGPCAPRH